jgi:hypothetical protein
MSELIHAFAVPYPEASDPAELGEPVHLGPSPRTGAAGPVGIYVGAMLREGRVLFDVLGDSFVQERVDEEPWMLDRLAIDPLVLEGLAVQRALAEHDGPAGLDRLFDTAELELLRVAA